MTDVGFIREVTLWSKWFIALENIEYSIRTLEKAVTIIHYIRRICYPYYQAPAQETYQRNHEIFR